MEDSVTNYAKSIGAELKDKKGVWTLSKVVAERKAFLSKKKLTYTAKFRIDDDAKQVVFSEYLAEKGSGFTGGSSGFDDGMSTGMGFSKTSYNTSKDGISGSIQEQSNLFGKQYSYDFKYDEVRTAVEDLAKKAGYEFEYKVLPFKV